LKSVFGSHNIIKKSYIIFFFLIYVSAAISSAGYMIKLILSYYPVRSCHVFIIPLKTIASTNFTFQGLTPLFFHQPDPINLSFQNHNIGLTLVSVSFQPFKLFNLNLVLFISVISSLLSNSFIIF